MPEPDTITAIATPPGVGAIGIVRLSGPDAGPIARELSGGAELAPGAVHKRRFYQRTARGPQPIDEGLVLFFRRPHSYTGEDVVELHGHGNPWLLRQLLDEAVQRGARLANPGEFTERAFLNGKLDLLQAEAVCDLIHSSSLAAARAAAKSLSGHFSEAVQTLAGGLLALRAQWEAHLDFGDENIEPESLARCRRRLGELRAQADGLLSRSRQGSGLREGLRVTIAGAVNAGKSTLFNRLAQQESAIVNPRPGTTRDVIRAQLRLDHQLLDLSDTAGLRPGEDDIEREGIKRSFEEMERADHILWVQDLASVPDAAPDGSWARAGAPLEAHRRKITLVWNKCDLTGQAAGFQRAAGDSPPSFRVSAQRGDGVDALLQHLRQGNRGSSDGEVFLARQRHIAELERVAAHLRSAFELADAASAEELAAIAEIVAEELGGGAAALNRMTGAEGTERLLDEIFSSFCIGK